eukprot:TRINITY_DN3576_c0_g1_i1.p1 TRINITY_DN3576_c0_g1~~TRINITY_DN3576_c0_g1_i1.p1  ORF type:complete len:811 (-),score=113.02 TRINITY_DN3576_c0_g1_i1:48-2480(-)
MADNLDDDDGSFLECPICFFPVEELDHIVILRSEQKEGYCNHSYCRDCAQELLDRSENPICPQCQRKILGYETNRMAMELKDVLRKMKQDLKQAQQAHGGNHGQAGAEAANALLQKQREEHDRAMRELQAEIEGHRKTSAELRSQLQEATANAERLHQELRGRESELQRELREQSVRNDVLRQRAADLERQIGNLQAADGARAEQLGKLLVEQRAEIERGRQMQQQLEQQLASTKVEAEKSKKQEQNKRMEIEQRYLKTVDKFHSMREQFKRKEIQNLVSASSSTSSPTTTRGGSVGSSSSSSSSTSVAASETSTLAASSLSPLASTISSLWQSPMKLLRSFTGAGASGSERTSTSGSGSTIGKVVSYYLRQDYSGDLILPMRNFRIMERRGSKRTSNVWRAELANPNSPTNAPRGSGKVSSALRKSQLPAYIAAPKTTPPERSNPLDDPAAVAPAQSPSEADYDRNYHYYSKFREALILQSIDHPYIIKLNGIIRDSGNLYTVMPFYEEDLEFVSEENPLTLPQIQLVAFQLLQAVMYLHKQDIVHRNIQPSVVMLSTSGSASAESIARKYSVRLAGLSHARSLRPPFPKHLSDLKNVIEESSLSLLDPSQPWFEDLMTPDASMRYWAPEIILKEYLHMVFPSFDWRKADMWSLGVTIAEMLRQGRRMFLSAEARSLLDEMVSFSDCRPTDATILDRFPFLNVPLGGDAGRDLENWLMAPRGTNERKIREVGMFGQANHNKMKERAVDLVRRLLQVDPKKRISVEEALSHPFFEEIRPNMIQPAGLKPVADLVTDDKLQLFVHGRCGGI